MSAQAGEESRVIEVTARDLPVHCPMPGTPVWSMHPRVFLDVAKARELICPYCGARYVYKGEAPAGH
ncbi:MAG: zinc-finger domain protein [Proteobacteria bacterium]|jgi:uncharacterized Zn-finger protein|nr:zinc-finger domain protein [Pseudomonadota bacterium]